MKDDKADILRGTLDLLILKTLDTLGPVHGYGIAQRIQQVSGAMLSLNQGTLYPALLRLEQRGWIRSRMGVSDNNRKARFYALTAAGRRQLRQETSDWLRASSIVNNILASSLYTRSGKWKHVIVVDEDINIEDPNEVLWALTTRFQPATDMFVIPRSITSSLEPSAGADGLTSKLMLDLTIKENFRGEVAEPTDAMRQEVLQRWKEYGFK